MSTYATAADVIAIAPALATFDADVLDEIVAEAALHVSAAAWGDKLLNGHRLLAAHMATEDAGGGGGVVASRTIDKLSESYAVGAVSDAELSTTKFGRRFISLRNTLASSAIVRRTITDDSGWELPGGRLL